jgi:hypothetical protein
MTTTFRDHFQAIVSTGLSPEKYHHGLARANLIFQFFADKPPKLVNATGKETGNES